MGSSSEGTVRCLILILQTKHVVKGADLNAFDDFQRFVATIKAL